MIKWRQAVIFSVWILSGLVQVPADTHQYIAYQIISPNNTRLPKFVCVSQLDDIPTRYYDSDLREVIPLNGYNLAIESPMVLKRHSIQCQQWELQHLEDYKLIVDELSKANYSKESVYIQIIKGCEMNTKNQKMDGFTRYALNGKDFMSTTWATKYWDAIHPAARLVAEQWNSEEEKLNDHRVMSRTFCHYIIKTNLEMLSWRTASPKVSIHARVVIDSAPTSLLCHVTQFYPRDIDVTWERNGISMQNEQLRRQTLPNGDLTYQVTVEIETSHPASEYSCVVKHQSLAQELHLKWDPKHRFHLAVLILAVLFITSGLVIAYFSWRYSQVLMNTFRNCCKKYEKPKEQEKS